MLPLELVNPRFYHLDTCFCPLAPGVAIYYPEAFDPYGRRVLETHVKTLVPVAELVLGKQRILELYLNVVEWGPGIYGADAVCRTDYRTSARGISRAQAARLAAILPAPLKRKPERMNSYGGIILRRMAQMGW